MNKTEKAYNKTASMSSSSSGSLLDYDPRTTKLLQSAQLLTSLLSFTASLLIALMIRSKSDSFSQPSRRIIFAMSCADMLSSLGLFTGPFLVPNGAVQYTIGGPSGTIATCELNGFLFILGSSAAPMYTCALCSYYFCKINHNMPDREFAERIEKKIHIINISWSIVGALVALFTNIINSVPGGDFCYIGADPGCKENPDIECERGQHHDIYAMIISYLPNLLSFLGVISTMVLICAKVFSQEKRNAAHRFTRPVRRSMIERDTGRGNISSDHSQVMNTRTSRRAQPPERPIPRNSINFGRFFVSVRNSFSRRTSYRINSEASDSFLSRSEINSRKRRKETVIQASLYVGTFLLVYIWPYIFFVFEFLDKEIPLEVSLLLYIFYPLAGLFNILIYTRQNVKTIRKRHPDYWWPQAFWQVLKAGGECPPLPPNPNRTSFRGLRQAATGRVGRRGESLEVELRRLQQEHDVESPPLVDEDNLITHAQEISNLDTNRMSKENSGGIEITSAEVMDKSPSTGKPIDLTEGTSLRNSSRECADDISKTKVLQVEVSNTSTTELNVNALLDSNRNLGAQIGCIEEG